MQKILLITPSYLNLYQYIVDELKTQGYKVTVVTEKDYIQKPPETPYHSWTGLKPLRKFIFEHITRDLKRFWKKEAAQNEAFQSSYEHCIVINGELVNRWLLNELKRRNPSIKTTLYLWDSSKWYDYYRIYSVYDKVFTFDYSDSLRFPGVKYLPFFIPKDKRKSFDKIVYDISSIGTDHDMRSAILRNHIIPQCQKEGMQYFFKLLPFDKNQLKDNEDGLFIADKISDVDYNNVIRKSNCILDIDRDMQQALTPRLLWALSCGKKIITTNKNYNLLLKDYCSSAFISKHIEWLDRFKPVLNISFCKEKVNSTDSQDILHELYIENWVRIILL